jgi:hypothetical protein
MRRVSLTLDPEVAQFLADWAEQERERLGWPTSRNMNKGHFISGCVKESKAFKEWKGKR